MEDKERMRKENQKYKNPKTGSYIEQMNKWVDFGEYIRMQSMTFIHFLN